jgi:hypothetical protein
VIGAWYLVFGASCRDQVPSIKNLQSWRGTANCKECAYINYYFGSGGTKSLLEPFWLWRDYMFVGLFCSGDNKCLLDPFWLWRQQMLLR